MKKINKRKININQKNLYYTILMNLINTSIQKI